MGRDSISPDGASGRARALRDLAAGLPAEAMAADLVATARALLEIGATGPHLALTLERLASPLNLERERREDDLEQRVAGHGIEELRGMAKEAGSLADAMSPPARSLGLAARGEVAPTLEAEGTLSGLARALADAADEPSLAEVAPVVMAISETIDEIALAVTVMTSLPERDPAAGRALGDGIAPLNTADAIVGELSLAVQRRAEAIEWSVRGLTDPDALSEIRSPTPHSSPPPDGNGRPADPT